MLKIAGGIVLGIFGFFLACFVLVDMAVYANETSDNQSPVKLTESQAIELCQSEMLKKIDTPMSAEFDSSIRNVMQSPISGTTVITDSMNFVNKRGMRLKSIFNCKIKLDGDKWTPSIITNITQPNFM
jgi:hypothetical protein